MDNRLQLFVERQDSAGDFVEVDMFNDESVNVVDSIQNVKDISKIFAPFTRAFHLPSSPTNDEVFGYYYNNQVDTYDARFKTRAIIKISGADYKIGQISMNNSTMIDSNNATSYNVKFTDETITLKDKIGDDKLSALDYSGKINLDNKLSTIVNGIRQGLYKDGTTTPETDIDGNDLYPDVIYAPIFTKGKAVPVPFKTNTSAPTSNDYEYFLAYFNGDAGDGVNTESDFTVNGQPSYVPDFVRATDYRPSVKVSTMLDMINEKYSLGLSTEFMYREELDQLYLWHNGKAQSDLRGSNAFSGEGIITSNNLVSYTIESFTRIEGLNIPMSPYVSGDSLGSADDEVLHEPMSRLGLSELTIYLNKGGYTGRVDAKVRLDASVQVGAIRYRTPVWIASIADLQDDGDSQDGGTTFSKDNAASYEDSFGYSIWEGFRQVGDSELTFNIEISSSSAISADASIAIKTDFKTHRRFIGENNIGTPPISIPYDTIIDTSRKRISSYKIISTGSEIDLRSVAPEMKVLDFVSGIFKMFNLTYQSTDRFTTSVETIDEFYNNPDKVDIGEHVDLRGATISKALIYKDVTMKYNKSDDAMSGQYQPRANGELFPDFYDNLTSSLLSGSNASTDGESLSIKSPFSCMMYERLYTSWSDEGLEAPYVPEFDVDVNHGAPNAITDVVVGHSIDSSLNKKDIKNLLFYGKKVDIRRNFNDQGSQVNGVPNGVLGVKDEFTSIPEYGNSAGSQGRLVGLNQSGYNYNHTLILAGGSLGSPTVSGFGGRMITLRDEDDNSIGNGQYATQWWNPSNIMASKFRRNGLYMNDDAKIQGLQFNSANSEEYEYKSYINTGTTEAPVYPVVFNTSDWINGLYDTYYRKYLENLYDKSARLYKVNAKLPDHLISSYKMNDVYRVGNKEFTINKANINLMNGESSLELLTHIPDFASAAVINGDALSLADNQFYDESIEFNLEPIKIVNNNFPTSVKIISGALNNDYEYINDGLIPTDYINLGSNNYALRGIQTPKVGSGQTDWVRTNPLVANPHKACAILENDNGALSNLSNEVFFNNPIDSVSPTGSMNVVAVSSTMAEVNVQATDNVGGSGVGRVLITSTLGLSPTSTTQVDQAYNGDYTSFECNVDTGLNTFRTTFTDNSGNESVTYVQTISVTIPDTTPPEEPTLTGSEVYNGGNFNIDLFIGNIYDNIYVDYITIMRSVNGGAYSVLDTEDPTGDASIEYRDSGLDDEDNYRYYVFATDADGNQSTNSSIYEYIGDSDGDL